MSSGDTGPTGTIEYVGNGYSGITSYNISTITSLSGFTGTTGTTGVTGLFYGLTGMRNTAFLSDNSYNRLTSTYLFGTLDIMKKQVGIIH